MMTIGEADPPEKLKLLLVDDEKDFVEVLLKRLKRRDIDATAAYSGEEAIRALRKVDFHAAILDMKMEDMDGLEVLRVFKKMYPEMEVIILSGHETEQTVREALEQGAYDYLSKPCDFNELIRTIQEATAGKKP